MRTLAILVAAVLPLGADAASVIERGTFYNNSAFDTVSDANAIAPGKAPLVFGSPFASAALTSYAKGLTGIVVSIQGTVDPGGLSVADFAFRSGTDPDPATWSNVPVPTALTVLPGGGPDGADRVLLTLEDGVVADGWLEVTVRATSATGLAADDVFYFGNVRGDVNGDGQRSAIDSLLLINQINLTGGGPVPITSPYDINRDGSLSPQDVLQVINLLNGSGVVTLPELVWIVGLPAVATTAAVAIGSTTATSGGTVESAGGTVESAGGTVTSAGGGTVTARGVCWSTAANPTVDDAKTTDGAGTGEFASTLTKLSPGTTYYVRAYATNSAGTGYGKEQSVTMPVSKGADFVVTGMVLTPRLPAVGGKFTATISVQNQGALSGKAGTLYVWTDKPAPAVLGEKGDKSASLGTLKPGQVKLVKLSLAAPKTWDKFTLRAVVDAKNVTNEDDEYNNQETYGYATGLPDFEVLDVSISPEIPVAGKTFTAYVTVTNSGGVAGNAGYLDLWADSSVLATAPVPGPKTKGNKYKTVGTLQPGQEKVITVTGLKAPAGTAWILGVLIDSRARTLEMDETDNWFEFGYGASDTLSPPPPPPPPG